MTILLRLALVVLLCGAGVASADGIDPTLITAAQKEGRVVWYTTQIIDQVVRPAAAAFEKKYGIKVDYVRTDSNGVVLRILNEAKAGKVQADVFDGTAGVAPLRARNLVMQWVPPSARRFSPQYIDPDGYWASTNIYVLTPGYNTSLVSAADAPKSFQDLLDPKWKDQLTWNVNPTTSGAAGFIGVVLAAMGENDGRAYLKRLAQQNILGVQGSARQVLDQVIAGESEVALNIFNNHAVISAGKGAPVKWIAMQPAEAVLSVISVTRDAVHPNAGKLLTEFLVSPEGQRIFRDANYIPADQDVPPLIAGMRPDGHDFKAITFSPDQIEKLMPEWVSLYDAYFKR